ncbi:MAG: bifunctional aspartate kinase/diaminopimelate decarboxylase [Steroidobacteraceae bacterium]
MNKPSKSMNPAASAASSANAWVVLKFGGTSVSSVNNWCNIASIVKARLAEGLQPVVVHSAVSKITDSLEQLLAKALTGGWETALDAIITRHRDLARDLGIATSAELEDQFIRLRQIAAGVALVGEISERLRARVMAQGELMATRLGAAFLASQGLDVQWIDARTVLKSVVLKNASTRASYLSATCQFEADAALQSQWSKPGRVYITQGFIASDDAGDTVLLGRGGSDTSGSYFAAKLQARRLEIWTDVPGMFSANPRSIPSARLLRALEYDEAQEIASAGAKVLHPRCIMPVKHHGIPLHVFATQTPDLEGTVITAHGGDGGAHVKAVTVKNGITLVSMDTVGMWHSVGFLADAFQVFKQHGMSVDLVSTSETNVTVSLDPAANTLTQEAVDALVADLAQLCRVEVIGPCAAVSLVGKSIRAILHKLGEALELFEEQKIYLVTQAANDLNLTFVLDEEQGDRLVSRLHQITISDSPDSHILGPTWEQLYGSKEKQAGNATAWWHDKQPALLQIANEHGAAYVYDRATLQRQARAMKSIASVDQVFFAMKANPHPEVLKLLTAEGLGLECVSRGELEHVFDTLPSMDRKRVLFTPNFAPRAEYEFALQQGVWVTLDNLYLLQAWPELFKGREVLLRVDTGYGRGHHHHVRTAGTHSKFGIPLSDFDELMQMIKQHDVRVVGLQAHTGSGVFNVDNWREVADVLAGLAPRFNDLRILDIGGGLGVPEKLGQPGFDIAALSRMLSEFKNKHAGIQLWMEPGRYLVAEAGVLLAKVTQRKGKGDVQYIGITTGMNSLIRPALYGAHHDIFNLSRLNEAATQTVNVVGPICESGDLLGSDRLLPPTHEGDVILIGTAGAYGHAMSSHYNLRDPAAEFLV